jgi:hypothetical protein
MFAGYGRNPKKFPEIIGVQPAKKALYIPSTVFFPAIMAFLRDRTEKNLMRTP